MYTVYILVDPRTDIVRYVGLTSLSIQERLKYHLRDKRVRNPYKFNWIQKLKKNGLIPKIIAFQENISEEEASKLEIDLISLFRKIVGKNLINIADGGCVPPILCGEDNPMYGIKSPHAKPVMQYSLDEKLIKKYSNLHEAAKVTGINRRNISKVCQGKRKTAGNFIWRYA